MSLENDTFNDGSQINIKNILRGESGIYFLVVSNYNLQNQSHAEKYLTDIVKIAQQLPEHKKEVHSAIAGRMRPCMTCVGEMTTVIDRFNPHSGLIWPMLFLKQPADTAARTLNVLLTQPASASSAKDGGIHLGYDSGSDSDDESRFGFG